jgi:hypothetical protein
MRSPAGAAWLGFRTGWLQRRRGRRCTRLSSWEPPEARTQRRHALYGRCATRDPGRCDQPGHIRLLAQSSVSPDAVHEASLKSSCTGWPSLRQAQGKQRLITPFSGSSTAVRASQLLSAGGRCGGSDLVDRGLGRRFPGAVQESCPSSRPAARRHAPVRNALPMSSRTSLISQPITIRRAVVRDAKRLTRLVSHPPAEHFYHRAGAVRIGTALANPPAMPWDRPEFEFRVSSE